MCHAYRFIALLLLLAYASTGTSVLPAVVLALAQIDGSHEAQVCASAQGMRVLLHHTDHQYTPEVADHGSALARALVRMCRPDAEGDHSLSLSQVTAVTNATDEAKQDLKEPGPLDALASAHFLQSQLEHGHLGLRRLPWTVRPRICGSQSHHLVATVHLLI